jgi:putative glutamine amidotransferase
MPTAPPLPRIGIYGPDDSDGAEKHGCGLWLAGFSATLQYAGAEPVPIPSLSAKGGLDAILEGLQGMVFTGAELPAGRQLQEAERLCDWCRQQALPLLGIDAGLHVLNTAFGGAIHHDLPRDMPEALQHRHPPEKGLRHAIAVTQGTRLADLYGDGEIIVNSEHRRAVQRAARGFVISARALDGVIEAIEAEGERWWAMGVQWHPASATASGLDIQLFRGLVEACRQYAGELVEAA